MREARSIWALFRVVEPLGIAFYPYGISADGQRILTLVPEKNAEGSPLNLITNWPAALKGAPAASTEQR